MIQRIEIWDKHQNNATLIKNISDFLSLEIYDIQTNNILTLKSTLVENDLLQVAQSIHNPVTQRFKLGWDKTRQFDWFIRIEFLPGVTDNVARSARECIEDILLRELTSNEHICSSKEYFIQSPNLTQKKSTNIAEKILGNKLIEKITIKSYDEWLEQGPLTALPIIESQNNNQVELIDLENFNDNQLIQLSRKNCLALSLEEMQLIQKYIIDNKTNRLDFDGKITDVELECLAQTWSEHCKHKIFAADIEYNDGKGNIEHISSLYKTYIQKSTKEISENRNWLVSVFKDNAGVIKFNDTHHLVYKVETHNSPSALDPYGGAMTGIVGVNRDPMGTGMGADLLINVWGYCFASPYTKQEEVPEGLLHPRRLRNGVHKGVIDGGNQSGIPYGIGWEFFDQRYLGKPLVYCGTAGLLPVKIQNTPGEHKEIHNGDIIVMAGGRVGKDGIHGATFSSEELHTDSPIQAVQIGDPITQKKMSDFIKVARDKHLYRFITDNGAGGLSSSIGEMAEISNGCKMDLSKVPVKYNGLKPWEILISEAQERMSFAVIPEKMQEFNKLAKKYQIEVSEIGTFNNTGKFHLHYDNQNVCLLDIDFMHTGLKLKLKARWQAPKIPEESIKKENIKKDILTLLKNLNISSFENKARQYDHEVKALSVIKPYIGKNRDVASDATVFMAEPCAKEGIVLAAALAPNYSDIDTYDMMASIIDMCIRKTICAGGKLEHMAGLDNFCWPDPVESEKTPDGQYKLAQLVRANKALYDYCKAFNVPCISGKDSMKNDSTIGGKKISIPPTVLFSTIAKIDDIKNSKHFANYKENEFIYILGETKQELGGSQFYVQNNLKSNNVPKVDAKIAIKTYEIVEELNKQGLVNAIGTPTLGGFASLWSKMIIASHCGLEIDLTKIPTNTSLSNTEIIFSETNSRIITTCTKKQKKQLETMLYKTDIPFACIGKTIVKKELMLKETEQILCQLQIQELTATYKTNLIE